jgi:hypothetical protein
LVGCSLYWLPGNIIIMLHQRRGASIPPAFYGASLCWQPILQQNNQHNKQQHESSNMTTPLLALLVWCVTTQVRSLLVVSKVIHLLLAMLAPQVSVSAAHSCMACHTVWWPWALLRCRMQ